ncbi:glycoside hydrolase family 13 protein [Paenibacillus silviterrae]|uniref:glycoside hydrolase family 13 protein n=1 Tax=Paenibacillus silviterrae TaxID=3242194 RepID=UPI002543A4F8|nr:alpha-glucosidase [Paenibacillus chinjuensis]
MDPKWWHKSVVYQIYPKSFYDANNDGTGDIQGITDKLDYLQELGIDIIWICPVNRSPMADNGYDISDYYEIAPEFGTNEQFEQLIREADRRGIKMMMDLVINHTSDEHPWFMESRSSKDNPKRDWYIWREPKQGREPNNWASYFSGSAWEFDSLTGEYYLHLYSKQQPDLNWENQQMREEIYQVIRYWAEKGVKGFRFDVISKLSKHQDFPDVPDVEEGSYALGRRYYLDGPRIHEFMKEIHQVYEPYDIVTVGETSGVTIENARLYTEPSRKELDMVFQFDHMAVDAGPYPAGKWEVSPFRFLEFKEIMSRWQKGLHGIGWNSLYWSNHDQPRAVSRFGNHEKYRVKSGKMLATCLHLMQGTPYIYQGEEIGMTNVKFESIGDYNDIELLNMYKENLQKGHTHEELMQKIWAKGRDNARTPMQWDDGEHAGFSQSSPWLKVNPNYKHINVKTAIADPDSLFYYYKRLIELRKDSEYSDVIVYGSYDLLFASHPRLYIYKRSHMDKTLVVICNFFHETETIDVKEELHYKEIKYVIGNGDVTIPGEDGSLSLSPYECMVYEID